MAEQTRLEAKVHGRVQGVSFRYYTRRRAVDLGLTGYVQNCWDGTVRVVAEGTDSALGLLVEFLHKGSPAAFVERVEVLWMPAVGGFDRFGVRY
jgi:acylphosphatase